MTRPVSSRTSSDGTVFQTCRICKKEKPIEEFGKRANYKSGHDSQCKECSYLAGKVGRERRGPAYEAKRSRQYYEAHKDHVLQRMREYRRQHPEKHREWSRRNKVRLRNVRTEKLYGVSPEMYNEILRIQGGHCAICDSDHPGAKNKGRFAIDHHHETGEVRGLLCDHCNRLLGCCRDQIDILRKAQSYLLNPPARSCKCTSAT